MKLQSSSEAKKHCKLQFLENKLLTRILSRSCFVPSEAETKDSFSLRQLSISTNNSSNSVQSFNLCSRSLILSSNTVNKIALRIKSCLSSILNKILHLSGISNMGQTILHYMPRIDATWVSILSILQSPCNVFWWIGWKLRISINIFTFCFSIMSFDNNNVGGRER